MRNKVIKHKQSDLIHGYKEVLVGEQLFKTDNEDLYQETLSKK